MADTELLEAWMSDVTGCSVDEIRQQKQSGHVAFQSWFFTRAFQRGLTEAAVIARLHALATRPNCNARGGDC